MIEFAVLTPKHWAGFVRLLGSPPELSDPALADPSEQAGAHRGDPGGHRAGHRWP